MRGKSADRSASGPAAIASSPGGNWSSGIQLARTVSPTVVELSLCSRPGSHPAGFGDQARSIYDNLLRALRTQGANPGDIVAEKVFFSDIGNQMPELGRIREDFYRTDKEGRDPHPATTYIQQPPARPGQLCEIQALALRSGDGTRVPARGIPDAPPGVSGKVVEVGGIRHLYLANVTGGSPGDGLGFPAQASRMFRRAETCLSREGLSFRDVLRTWIYIRDIDEDYGAFNRARTEFFHARGIHPGPASTGIQGIPCAPDRGCSLDLRAAAGKVRARPIRSPTMNEAPSYGSAFSRGTRVSLEDRTVLYISGTASIDTEGRVVHAGDIEGQVDRMLLNVEELLASQGASTGEVVSATTYLKEREFLGPFREVCRRRGFPEAVPNTICVADVCRPEWLCEMEAIAVLA